MTPDVLLMAAGELAIAGAVIVTSSLRFARWAIEREERDDLSRDLSVASAEVRSLRRNTLLKERERREIGMVQLVAGGYEKRATQERDAIAFIDRQLEDIDQAERYYAEQARGMQNAAGHIPQINIGASRRGL